MSSDASKRVIDLPEMDVAADNDSLYICNYENDYQMRISKFRDQILGAGNFLTKANYLSELADKAQIARNNLGLGSASTKDFGSGIGQLLMVASVNGQAALPPMDGSQLTGINSSSVNSVNPNTAGDGLGITNSNSLYVNCDNATLEVANDQVRIKDSGISSAKLSNGAVLGKHISPTAIDGTSIQIVNNQLKALGPTMTSGFVGTTPNRTSQNLVSSLYTIVSPPPGKSMANFLGGMSAVCAFGTADTDLGNDFWKSDYEVLTTGIKVWHLYSTVRDQIDSGMPPDTFLLNAISLKTSYIFFWS